MTTASEVSQAYDKSVEEKRLLLQDVHKEARLAATRLQDEWPADGFGHHDAPGVALTSVCNIDYDHVFLASNGTLWAGRMHDGEPSELEPIITDVHAIRLEWIQAIKEALVRK